MLCPPKQLTSGFQRTFCGCKLFSTLNNVVCASMLVVFDAKSEKIAKIARTYEIHEMSPTGNQWSAKYEIFMEGRISKMFDHC